MEIKQKPLSIPTFFCVVVHEINKNEKSNKHKKIEYIEIKNFMMLQVYFSYVILPKIKCYWKNIRIYN